MGEGVTTWTPTALSALHHKLLAIGATMIEMGEWQIAGWYTTPEKEIAHISESVGLVDFSLATKLNIQGDAVDAFIQNAYDQAPTLDVGRVWQGKLTTSGSDFYVVAARLSHDELLILPATEDKGTLLPTLSDLLDDCTHLVDMTSALCSIRVTGPRARQLMSRVTELDLRNSVFPDMSCALGKLSEIECTVLRHDSGGLTNFELYFSRDYGEYLWDSLTEAGSDMELIPYGVKAMMGLVTSEAGQ